MIFPLSVTVLVLSSIHCIQSSRSNKRLYEFINRPRKKAQYFKVKASKQNNVVPWGGHNRCKRGLKTDSYLWRLILIPGGEPLKEEGQSGNLQVGIGSFTSLGEEVGRTVFWRQQKNTPKTSRSISLISSCLPSTSQSQTRL